MISMDLTLTRNQYIASGIFGQLADEDGNIIAYTCEHAYDDGNGGWIPKVAAGSYVCQRGQHQLASMSSPFTAFQLMDVPDFQGNSVNNILIHMGNFDKDSEGCILIGQAIAGTGSSEMVTNSVATFNKFMALQSGIDQFNLTIS